MIPHQEELQDNNDRQSYMKFSINYIELYNNHLVFYEEGNDNNNSKMIIDNNNDLEIIVEIETITRIDGDNNRNGNPNREIRNKVQSIRLASSNNQNKRTIKEEQQESVIFSQSNNRWDCIKLDDSIVEELLSNNNSNKIKCELKLTYRIMKKNNNNNNNKQSAIDTNYNNSNSNNNNSNKKYIQLSQSQESSQISSSPEQSTSFSINKIITQSPPYTINELNVDIYLSNNKEEEEEKTTATTSTTSKRERDGTINLSIIYLPLINPEIVFKDIRLTTKSFNNQGFSVNIKQLFSNENDYYKDGENSSNKNKTKEENKNKQENAKSELNLILEPTNWQLYEHIEPKQKNINLPLVLHNNLDKVEFALLVNNSIGENKKENNKVENIINNELISLKTVEIDTLYNNMGKSKSIINKWSEYIINFEHIKSVNNKAEKQTYELIFMYTITMNLLMNNNNSYSIQESDCVEEEEEQEPKETNSKSLIEKQQQLEKEDVEKDGYEEEEDKSELFLLIQSGFGNNNDK